MGQVYCTSATAELGKIVMMDSSRISDIYSSDDVDKVDFFEVDANEQFKPGASISLKENLRATFLRSSHILGATGISINWGMDKNGGLGKTIHFSGDIGSNFEDNCYLPLLKHNFVPFPDTDYIVVESTYGGRIRDEHFKSSENRLNKLKELIEDTIFENNGKLIIPSFSIHRTQEIMVDLYRVLTEYINVDELQNYLNQRNGYDRDLFSVYCHSPMAKNANAVFANELLSKLGNGKYKYKNNSIGITDSIIKNMLGKGSIKFNNGTCLIKVTDPKQDPKKISSNGSIIIASSGMCDAGPIGLYLDSLGSDKKNKVVITGYQAIGGRGRRILDKKELEIKAQVEEMSGYYSAHADELGLLEYIFDTNNSKYDQKTSVLINHGTRESKEKLEAAVKLRADDRLEGERVIESIIPLNGENGWFDLNSGEELVDSDVRQLSELHKKVDHLTELVELLVSVK